MIKVLLGLVLIAGCAHPPRSLTTLDPTHQQAVIVTPRSKLPLAYVALWQRNHHTWEPIYRHVPAVVGRTGIAKEGQKKEGDGHTPSGSFTLTESFGYGPVVNTGLTYRKVGADDFWVDDVDSSQYNLWIRSKPQANSFERLLRDDHLYKLAVVIDYNRNPVVKGAGSAIFMHIWRRWDQPTAGCVATSERNLRKIAKRLDLNQHPIIIIEDGRSSN